jgi:hypothetical protein
LFTINNRAIQDLIKNEEVFKWITELYFTLPYVLEYQKISISIKFALRSKVIFGSASTITYVHVLQLTVFLYEYILLNGPGDSQKSFPKLRLPIYLSIITSIRVKFIGETYEFRRRKGK